MTIRPDDFVLCPDHGSNRLIRFDLPIADGMVARLDKDNNILHVNQVRYDELSEYEQDRVIKTRQSEVWRVGDRLFVEGCYLRR